MVEEVLAGLQVEPGKIFLDGTVGYGGHAEAILERTSPEGRLIGLDRDPAALQATASRLASFGKRVMLEQLNYKDFDCSLQKHSIPAVDGILLDLGVSLPQFATAERGFSFQHSAPLDMRMDPSQEQTAATILNEWPEKELADLFYNYGEERWARRYARAIVKQRESEPLATTEELADLIRRRCPDKKRRRIHPATRVFQALRIAVNQELEALDLFLEKFDSYLRPHGRIAILSYHSLEDRRVKLAFRKGKGEGHLLVHTKKPLQPSTEEVATNPQARSAKLRVAEHGERT